MQAFSISRAILVIHTCQCDACQRENFTGFRYRCQKCPHYTLCQDCFWRGRVSTPHTLEHNVREYSSYVSLTSPFINKNEYFRNDILLKCDVMWCVFYSRPVKQSVNHWESLFGVYQINRRIIFLDFQNNQKRL